MAALDEKDDAKDEGGGGGDGKLSKAAAKRSAPLLAVAILIQTQSPSATVIS